ncbi:MAG: hypothetical protein JST39_22100, partial [Bacteroidetes bacterium]|nr:hypothetical protein [Bacteroidota bacterium]
KDLLAPDIIDPTYGRVSLVRNAGTARNTGFELTVDGDVIRNKSFGWNVMVNGSYNNSKVISFNYNYLYTSYLTLLGSASLFGGSGGATLRNGYPLDALFSFPFAGLDNTGTAYYYNAAKNKVLGGNVTVNDMTYSGTIRPKYVFGITNTFSYHRFDFSFMLVGQAGGVFRKDTYSGANYSNKYVAQRWRKPGDEATTIYPRLNVAGTDLYYFPYGDMLVEKSDFIKLRDVTLTYSLNDRIFGHSGFNGAKVYFQGRNLAMVTANHDNVDPETMVSSDGSIIRTLPLRPELYLGFSINF